MASINSANLAVNQPITASEPALSIVVDPTKPLRVGAYTFQLVVVDDSGNASSPVTARVIVADDKKPTAVIDAPTQASFGANFALSGARSLDVGGTVKQYTWTLIQAP